MKLKLLIVLVMVSIFSFAQLPKPNFHYTYSIGNNREIILNFSSLSQGENLQYEWSFPGALSTNSNLQNPTVTYSQIGVYEVTLKIKNTSGESSLRKKIIISGDATSQIINLSTGMNNDGTTLNTNNIPDTNWTVTNSSGVTDYPKTRQNYSDWSTPTLEQNTIYNGKTTWVRSESLYTGYGDYIYKSKVFTIPEYVLDQAKLSFKALAFVRHWSSLVKINDDGTETEVEEISRTSWLSDGAKGWLNSRNSGVENFTLLPGKYYIKSKVYTNNGNLRDAFSANGLVSIGNTIKVEAISLPVLNLNKHNICKGNTETITSNELNSLDNSYTYEWKIFNTQNTYTSTLKAPSFQFLNEGNYTVELLIKKANLSNLYIFKDQILVQPCNPAIDPNELASPNSYIYDIDLAKDNNYGGIFIPVKKAYDVWQDPNGFINNTIPNAQQSASVVWQDKENLISNVTIVGNGKDAKLKVEVNSAKGKGNAVIALHIGNNGNDSDPIYWSWHVWVTENPTNGVTYVNNGDSRMVNTFMDRNLGALSDDFLGEDWNKSGGLMYQWGRKDPFPPMRFTDETLLRYYLKNNEELNNNNFNSKFVKFRPYNTISDNIKYVIQNPLNFISTEQGGTWFASNDNKYKSNLSNYDLWSDNNKGETKKESFNQQIKSPYDPCPSGWRVPSFAHSESSIPNYSPWGSKFNYTLNDDPNYLMKESDSRYPNAKFYLRMGVDFKNGSDNYNLGKYSSTGGFKRASSGNIEYQDNYSESNIWSATLRSDVQGRNFHIINDPDQGVGGRFLINTAQEGAPSEGYAVRCVKDVTTSLVFNTEYFNNETKRNYEEGLDNPNSYILYENREVSIPVNKAYAVYNQVSTDRDWIPQGIQTSNVYWTTNNNLIKSIDINGSDENAKIKVILNDNQFGNAVVSLHIGSQGTSNDPVYWSWHIWVPKSNPEINPISYVSDESTPSDFKVYNTKFGFPPMITEFMNRPLGAVDGIETLQGNSISPDAYGMMYQWGRKDPIPGSFKLKAYNMYPIFIGKRVKGSITYTKLAEDVDYVNNYYQYNLQNNLSAREMKMYSIQNPLSFLLNTVSNPNDWLSNIPNLEKERWGHASGKSIYDPCPEGWRVPDYGFNNNINSPWGMANLYTKDQDKYTASSTLSKYGLSKILNNGYLMGFVGSNDIYNIGYIPAIGYRLGGLVTNGYSGKTSAVKDYFNSSSVWSGTMIPDYRGFVFGMDTSNNNTHLVHNPVNPYQGRSVICSKDTPRFTEEYFEELLVSNTTNKTLVNEVLEINEINNLNFYPNPVDNILRTTSNESYNVKIYSISGEKVLEGRFINKELNVSILKSGIYVLVLDDGSSFKIIKK